MGIAAGNINNATNREYNKCITKLWQLNQPNLRQIKFAAPLLIIRPLSVRPRADHELNDPGNPLDISCGSLSNSALILSLNFPLFGYDVFILRHHFWGCYAPKIIFSDGDLVFDFISSYT